MPEAVRLTWFPVGYYLRAFARRMPDVIVCKTQDARQKEKNSDLESSVLSLESLSILILTRRSLEPLPMPL